MPDITMCKGKGCEKKDRCYRHTAKSDTLQSFFIDTPPKIDGKCHYFWETKGDPSEQSQR